MTLESSAKTLRRMGSELSVVIVVALGLMLLIEAVIQSAPAQTRLPKMNNHIKLFVNEFTLNLGLKGRAAITELFKIAGDKKVIPSVPRRIFLTE